MKIGIIGIGMLGNAVALHLLDSGFDVTVYNRTKEKTNQVKQKGAKIVTSPKIMAKNVELIITIVKDAKAVRDVIFGKDGIIESQNKKLIIADMSTIDPVESKNIAKELQQHQIEKLEIPVMGGPNVAINGELVMMVSGKKNNFEYDPLWQLKRKIIINNSNDLIKLFKKRTFFSQKKILGYINFANNFYRPVNYKKLREKV